MLFKKMSESVADAAEKINKSAADIAEQTKDALRQAKKMIETSEKEITEATEEFKDLSSLAKLGIVAIIRSNVISIAVGITTLRRLRH